MGRLIGARHIGARHIEERLLGRRLVGERPTGDRRTTVVPEVDGRSASGGSCVAADRSADRVGTATDSGRHVAVITPSHEEEPWPT